MPSARWRGGPLHRRDVSSLTKVSLTGFHAGSDAASADIATIEYKIFGDLRPFFRANRWPVDEVDVGACVSSVPGCNKGEVPLLENYVLSFKLAVHESEVFCPRYSHKPQACVTGKNLPTHADKTVAECADICDENSSCEAFEFPSNTEVGLCRPQSSANDAGCDGVHYNLDLYVPPVAVCDSESRSIMRVTTGSTTEGQPKLWFNKNGLLLVGHQQKTVESPAPFEAGETYDVTVTHINSQLSISVDGNLGISRATPVGTEPAAAGVGELMVGWEASAGYAPAKATISEARFVDPYQIIEQVDVEGYVARCAEIYISRSGTPESSTQVEQIELSCDEADAIVIAVPMVSGTESYTRADAAINACLDARPDLPIFSTFYDTYKNDRLYGFVAPRAR